MFYLYKVTDTTNNMLYIGVRKHNNPLADKYMGSGVYLKCAQKSHGILNFTKEILYTFDDEDTVYLMLSLIVDHHYVKRPDTYNLCCGGRGGWHTHNRQLTNKKISISRSGQIATLSTRNILSLAHKGKKQSPLTKEKISKTMKLKLNNGLINRPSHQAWNKGLSMSLQTKKKISLSKKGTKLSELTKKKMSKRMIGNQYNKKKR